ncbi:MAG: ABC transporter ATP-binding protein [Fusobacteriota bacterium]
MNDIVLKLVDIKKEYVETDKKKLKILNGINLEICRGDFVSIIGKSGSGKSTLLNLLGVLDSPTSGNLYINNKKIDNNLKEKDKNIIRKENIGFVFQFHYLLTEFNAIENVMIPGLGSDFKKGKVRKRAKQLLTEMGLEDRLYHKPKELSGGEKQRVAIARAMINDPEIILADEPTGNLDEETSQNINLIFKKINKEKNQTIITVTHNKELANLARTKLRLHYGKLENIIK